MLAILIGLFPVYKPICSDASSLDTNETNQPRYPFIPNVL